MVAKYLNQCCIIVSRFGRVLKASDLKSDSLRERRFKSYLLRLFASSGLPVAYLSITEAMFCVMRSKGTQFPDLARFTEE